MESVCANVCKRKSQEVKDEGHGGRKKEGREVEKKDEG